MVIDPAPAPNGGNPLEKALGDLNGDGRPDAILGVGNSDSGGLWWYEAPAAGAQAEPWARHAISTTGSFYEDMLVADVNGDGAPDIIAGVDGTVSWFENPAGAGGDPAAGPWARHVIRADGAAHVLALADLDGDGRLDVVCAAASTQGASAAILFQDGPDAWTETRFGPGGEGIALLDIGAGKGAVNIVTAVGDTLLWYENPRETGGDARLGAWAPHAMATIPHAGDDPIAAGVLSAGRPVEVVVASGEDYPDNPPGLYRLSPQADPRAAWGVQVLDTTYVSVHKLTLADMNRDGLADIVLAEQEQAHNAAPGFNQEFDRERVAILLNRGDGGFVEQVVATTGAHNQAVADVNGDGYPDILGANHGVFGAPHPLELWLSQPAAAPWP